MASSFENVHGPRVPARADSTERAAALPRTRSRPPGPALAGVLGESGGAAHASPLAALRTHSAEAAVPGCSGPGITCGPEGNGDFDCAGAGRACKPAVLTSSQVMPMLLLGATLGVDFIMHESETLGLKTPGSKMIMTKL